MIPTTRYGRLRKCLGRALGPTPRAGSPCARWERPPLSEPTMHRSTHSSTIRVRIEARRADHPSQPSHFSQRRKGAIAGGTENLDSTGLLIEGTFSRRKESQASGLRNLDGVGRFDARGPLLRTGASDAPSRFVRRIARAPPCPKRPSSRPRSRLRRSGNRPRAPASRCSGWHPPG